MSAVCGRKKSIWTQCGVSGWYENYFGRETICEDEVVVVVVVVVVGRLAVKCFLISKIISKIHYFLLINKKYY